MTQDTSTTSSATARLQRLNNWKLPIMVGGGFLGATLGALAARLYIRSDAQVIEHERRHGPQGLGFSPSLILPIAITLVGLIREIAALADEKSEK